MNVYSAGKSDCARVKTGLRLSHRFAECSVVNERDRLQLPSMPPTSLLAKRFNLLKINHHLQIFCQLNLEKTFLLHCVL